MVLMTLPTRLREWWRVHYMERGFGFLVPGWERQRERDHRLLFGELWSRLRAAYPEDDSSTYAQVVVFQGIPYVGRTPAEIEVIMSRISAAYRIPLWYIASPQSLYPVVRPLYARLKRGEGK